MGELVSVVITTYGRAEMLKNALKSVITQTYDNLDIIVVDDNARMTESANVSQICEAFGDPRIRIIRNERNLGGALSRNVGIQESKGRYVAFLDDDDEYYPKKVERQYLHFCESADPRLALVYCYCEERDAEGKVRRFYEYDYEGYCLYQVLQDCIAATSQWMCDKEKLISVGMFSNVPCKQDSVVLVKLLSAGYTVSRVPEVLSVYNNHIQGRISSNNHKKRIEGEEYLIDLCRTQYNKIDKRQAQEVEYNFRKRVYKHYFYNRNYGKFLVSLLFMAKKHPRNTAREIKHFIFG